MTGVRSSLTPFYEASQSIHEEDAVGLRVKALYTGQNPASAAPLAEQVLAALH